MADLDELDHRLLAQLASYGPRGIWPGVPELAAKLDHSVRTVQRHLRRLETAGMVRRLDVFERPDDPNWTARGRRVQHCGRQTSSTYTLTYGVTGPGDTPNPGDTLAEQLERSESVSPLYQGEPTTPPVVEDGVDIDEQHNDVTGVEVDPWPVDTAGCFEPVALHVPEADQLARAPSQRKILDTIAAGGLGDARVLEMRRHPDAPPLTYPIRGGREFDLEHCSTEDPHRALDQLDRDTCWGGSCPNGCRSKCAARCSPDGRRRCHRHRRHNGGAR